VVDGALSALGVGAAALFSTLGRTAARGLETKLAARWLMEEYDRLIANLKSGVNLSAMVPVSIRASKDLSRLGNQFGLVILSLPVGVRDPVQRLRG